MILVDTKYEFGYDANGEITLIDEIHTPDSSRYFYLDTYEDLQTKGLKQKQLSKEFFREWLMKNNFRGLEGQKIPKINDDVVEMVSNRYIEQNLLLHHYLDNLGINHYFFNAFYESSGENFNGSLYEKYFLNKRRGLPDEKGSDLYEELK